MGNESEQLVTQRVSPPANSVLLSQYQQQLQASVQQAISEGKIREDQGNRAAEFLFHAINLGMVGAIGVATGGGGLAIAGAIGLFELFDMGGGILFDLSREEVNTLGELNQNVLGKIATSIGISTQQLFSALALEFRNDQQRLQDALTSFQELTAVEQNKIHEALNKLKDKLQEQTGAGLERDGRLQGLERALKAEADKAENLEELLQRFMQGASSDITAVKKQLQDLLDEHKQQLMHQAHVQAIQNDMKNFNAGMQSLNSVGDILFYAMAMGNKAEAEEWRTIYSSGVKIIQSVAGLVQLYSTAGALGLSNIAIMGAGLALCSTGVGAIFALSQLGQASAMSQVMSQLAQLSRFIENFANEMRQRLDNVESMLTSEVQLTLAVLRFSGNIQERVEKLQTDVRNMNASLFQGLFEVTQVSYVEKAEQYLRSANYNDARVETLTPEQYDDLNEPLAFFGTWAVSIATRPYSILNPESLTPAEKINLYSVEESDGGGLAVRASSDINRYLNYMRRQAQDYDVENFQRVPTLAHPTLWQVATRDMVKYMSLVKHLLNQRDDEDSLRKHVRTHQDYVQIIEEGRDLLKFNQSVRFSKPLFRKLIESVEDAFGQVAGTLNQAWMEHLDSREEYHDGRRAKGSGDAHEYIPGIDSLLPGKSTVPEGFVPGLLRKHKVFVYNGEFITWDGENADPPYDGGLRPHDYSVGPFIFEEFYKAIEIAGRDQYLKINNVVLQEKDAPNPFSTSFQIRQQHGGAWAAVMMGLYTQEKLQKIYNEIRKQGIHIGRFEPEYLPQDFREVLTVIPENETAKNQAFETILQDIVEQFFARYNFNVIPGLDDAIASLIGKLNRLALFINFAFSTNYSLRQLLYVTMCDVHHYLSARRNLNYFMYENFGMGSVKNYQAFFEDATQHFKRNLMSSFTRLRAAIEIAQDELQNNAKVRQMQRTDWPSMTSSFFHFGDFMDEYYSDFRYSTRMETWLRTGESLLDGWFKETMNVLLKFSLAHPLTEAVASPARMIAGLGVVRFRTDEDRDNALNDDSWKLFKNTIREEYGKIMQLLKDRRVPDDYREISGINEQFKQKLEQLGAFIKTGIAEHRAVLGQKLLTENKRLHVVRDEDGREKIRGTIKRITARRNAIDVLSQQADTCFDKNTTLAWTRDYFDLVLSPLNRPGLIPEVAEEVAGERNPRRIENGMRH